jgi:hypothetical protein
MFATSQPSLTWLSERDTSEDLAFAVSTSCMSIYYAERGYTFAVVPREYQATGTDEYGRMKMWSHKRFKGPELPCDAGCEHILTVRILCPRREMRKSKNTSLASI